MVAGLRGLECWTTWATDCLQCSFLLLTVCGFLYVGHVHYNKNKQTKTKTKQTHSNTFACCIICLFVACSLCVDELLFAVVVCCLLFLVGCLLFSVGCLLFCSCCCLLINSCLLVVCCFLLVVGYLLFVVSCLLFVVCCWLFVVSWLLVVCLLFVCCFLLLQVASHRGPEHMPLKLDLWRHRLKWSEVPSDTLNPLKLMQNSAAKVPKVCKHPQNGSPRGWMCAGCWMFQEAKKTTSNIQTVPNPLTLPGTEDKFPTQNLDVGCSLF